MREFLVVIEWSGSNWSAYSPDVPGCVAVGDSREEAEKNYKEALEVWIEEMKSRGLPIPEPRANVGRVQVAA
jgi:predicted RNase H-like HicB family nuclease